MKSKELWFLFRAFELGQMRGTASEKGRKLKKETEIFVDNLQNMHKMIADFLISVYDRKWKEWFGKGKYNGDKWIHKLHCEIGKGA